MPWRRLERPPHLTRQETRRFLQRATFYADANVDASLVEALRRLHHDVATAREIHAEEQPDEFHFRRAFRLNRVLLTQDRDFLDNDRFPLTQTRGVIIFNIDFEDVGQIGRALEVVDIILADLSPVLDESKVTVNSDYSLTWMARVPADGGFEIRKTRYRLDTNGIDVWIWEDGPDD